MLYKENELEEHQAKVDWLVSAPHYLSLDEATETAYYNTDPAFWAEYNEE